MKVSIPEDVLVQDLDGEMVLLNLQNEQYFGLDVVGSRMITVLAEVESLEVACERLSAEYEVEPTQLRQDVQQLLEQLVKHGLVKVAGA